jgi:lipid-A-disaccharide synthase
LPQKDGPHIVIVAGEASGDLHGAHLIRALKRELPGLRVSGIGGPAMQAEGAELVYHSRDLALMGFSEVLLNLGRVLGILKGMKRHLAGNRPDLVILIDFPDFNFRLGKAAKKMGLKVLYYVCPQVWAWRRGRPEKWPPGWICWRWSSPLSAGL